MFASPKKLIITKLKSHHTRFSDTQAIKHFLLADMCKDNPTLADLKNF